MNAFANARSNLPNLKNDGKMHVHLSGNHFQQNKVNIPVVVLILQMVMLQMVETY